MFIPKSMPRLAWSARSARLGLTSLLVAGSIALGAGVTGAAPVEVGYSGPSFAGGSVREPTAEKPESKLWYNDGTWWASMYSDDNPEGPALEDGYYIFKLNLSTKQWQRQDTQLDPRNTSSADVLWDGNKLYVASHIKDGDSQPNATGADNEKRLYRYTYNAGNDTYTLDSGFTAVGKKIADNSSETLTIAKETSGARIWATYVEAPVIVAPTPTTPGTYGQPQVMVTYSTDDGTTWAAPFSLASVGIAEAGNLSVDDIATIVAYNGRIGVMWSNQTTKKSYFAAHADAAAPNTWAPAATVLQDTTEPTTGDAADDHFNIKVQSSGNKLFAVTKTGFGDGSPDIVLLACTIGDCATPGNWQAYTVYTGQANGDLEHTRPILLLDNTPGNERIHIFTTQPTAGSPRTIYRKTVAMAGLNDATIAAAPSTPFIQSSADPNTNNPTTTKQSVNAQTGLVVLASDDVTDVYLWNAVSPVTVTPGDNNIYLPLVLNTK